MNKYMIYDLQNKCYLKGEYSTSRRSQNKADKLNLIFGGHRYKVTLSWEIK